MDASRSVLSSADSIKQFAQIAAASVAAAAAHGSVALAWLFWPTMAGILATTFPMCAPAPLIDEDAYMEVSMVVLPKSPTQMVHRASRAEVQAGSQVAEDVIAPKNPSDLTYLDEKAKVSKGAEDRNDRTEQLKKMALLAALQDAPEGPVDNQASDPNSTSEEAINAAGVGNLADPEYAKYLSQIEQLFKKDFHPLITVTAENPNLVCKIVANADPATGAVQSVAIKESSGNASFDGSAERAAQAVTEVPLPPERFRDGNTLHFLIRYRAAD